jgi:hypothetical protein
VGDIEDGERLAPRRRRYPDAGQLLLAAALTAAAVAAIIAIFGH